MTLGGCFGVNSVVDGDLEAEDNAHSWKRNATEATREGIFLPRMAWLCQQGEDAIRTGVKNTCSCHQGNLEENCSGTLSEKGVHSKKGACSCQNTIKKSFKVSKLLRVDRSPQQKESREMPRRKRGPSGKDIFGGVGRVTIF